MITKIRRSFPHPFWLTAGFYPIGFPTHRIFLDIERETLACANCFMTLTVYKRYPDLHLTLHDIHVLRKLMDTAEFHMGTHTGFYIQETEKIVQNQSNGNSLFLVVPELNPYSWWCQHLFFITSAANCLTFHHWWCQ